ncbi:MAG: SgcJ/EcaC family oxidoreductase [Rhodothermales bacterium]|nr:SgcJ/EcaC family oxidoreductase [Rhodothermales bacterium]
MQRTLMPRLVALALLLTVATTSAFGQSGVPDHITLPDELDRVLRDYEQGWRAGDAEALAGLFTPDGFILRPGHPPVRGREHIEEAYGSAGGSLILAAYDYAVEDSVGFIIGGFRYQEDQPDSGKYTLTLRKLEDGKWYIASDMDNGNRR